MASAITLAARGLGRVWPNPAVACLIVDEDGLISRARTADGGRPHAETQALDMAGPRARNATAYVTLEPCAHDGKTPPCAAALIKAGVARVVIASPDPDPRVSGRGVAMLREAGIDVTQDVLRAKADALNAGYLKSRNAGLPMVTLKLATTLDGRIALNTGESQWITGPAARARTHVMRAQHDAILVGSGTVLADDPALTARGLGDVPTPLRVVLDSTLKMRADAALADTSQAPTWVITTATAAPKKRAQLEKSGVRVIPVADKSGRINAQAAMKMLAHEGITRVFCEGGGTLAASLINAGLVDQIVLFTAGKLIGADGIAALGTLGLSRLKNAPSFRLAHSSAIGKDVLTIWKTAD